MRIPLLSDIHSNLAALDAVLGDAAAARADAPPWVLGDVVGYGPDPVEVVARLHELGASAVAGNHDLAAAGIIGVAEFNPLAAAAVRWTAGVIDEASRAYLSALPLRLEKAIFTLVHGSPRDPAWEYMTSPDSLEENLEHFATRACLFGHTHIPMVVVAGAGGPSEIPTDPGVPLGLGQERMFVNPGSVGQPRDGDARASYAVLDTYAETIEFRRVPYDFGKTQARMRKAGLPAPLIARLAFGR